MLDLYMITEHNPAQGNFRIAIVAADSKISALRILGSVVDTPSIPEDDIWMNPSAVDFTIIGTAKPDQEPGVVIVDYGFPQKVKEKEMVPYNTIIQTPKNAQQIQKRIAIIASMKKHAKDVLAAWIAFTSAGHIVVSPEKIHLSHDGKFENFDEYITTETQTRAIQSAFEADLTYVITPTRYIGNSVSYELGRLIQANKPVYFSSHPDYLPIQIPASHIISIHKLIRNIEHGMTPTPFEHHLDSPDHREIEKSLIKNTKG